MAIYRNVHMSFWTDSKVMDDFTPEDKLFFLYAMTNPRTSLCGCYECSKKQMSRDIGYSQETISNIIYRMDKIHNAIKYDDDTREILILNWGKYNWTDSDKVLAGAFKGAIEIKSAPFKYYVLKQLSDRGYPVPEDLLNDIPYQYPMDKTVTFPFTFISPNSLSNHNSDINNNSLNTVEVYKEPEPFADEIKEIVQYLNDVTGSKYSPNTAETKRLIIARLKEKRTVEDFKRVIDVKSREWLGTEQEKYLRPTTLFNASKFENYLNQRDVPVKKRKGKGLDWDELDEWARRGDAEGSLLEVFKT